MKKSYFTSLLYLTTTLFIVSCSKSSDDTADTTKPTIVINSPIIGETIIPGKNINFDANFSGNTALASYKIDIHNASDGHTHANSLATDTPWHYNQVYPINENTKKAHVNHSILAPTEINGSSIKQGDYHFGVYLIDKAGNEQKLFIGITIGEGGDHKHHHDH